MTAKPPTLFVSAVTAEFKSHRDALVKWFDDAGFRVETQERFRVDGLPTLDRISAYIEACDAVVHLAGDRTGDVANPATVERLLEACPDLSQRTGLTPEAMDRLTYTQWEAWLAIYHRKPLFVALPEEYAPRDSTLTDVDERIRQSDHQKQHVSALADRGKYPDFRFENSDQLSLNLVPLRDALLRGATSELNLTNILSLTDYRSSLAGFRRFLSSDNLPFQPPDPDDPCHPEQLLESLETSQDARGVLLSGAGGIGKTRTSFETALLAESRGWRVIFALPGQPAVTSGEIVDAVLALGPGKTLVIIEYLEQMQALDMGVLRRQLIQAAALQGIRFGLLANCRPGLLLKSRPEIEASFDQITLTLTAEKSERLSRFVAGHTAPQALAILGEPELCRLCGRRPIIALLVAQQLEQLAAGSQLVPGDVTGVRTGDLSHWLQRRLREDGLAVPEPESILESTRPPALMVAAAAALACSPDEKAVLAEAAAAALASLSVDVPPSQPARVVAILHTVGWLELEGPWLNVVHDVVADELVEQAVFDLDTVREPETAAILCPSVKHARSFGRVAKTLTRIGDSTTGIRAASLHAAAGDWLRAHAAEVGATLAADEADNASYALGAVLRNSSFEKPAIEAWHHIVSPWLKKHRTSYEARHILHRGLPSPHESVKEELVPVAMDWLEHWRESPQASFVFAPLLQAAGPDRDDAQRLLTWALAWVSRHEQVQEAQFVLGPLFSRQDLADEDHAQAVTIALNWLQRYTHKKDSEFVLKPLLEQRNLTPEAARSVIGQSVAWLREFGAGKEASYVIGPLLNRPDLDDASSATVLPLALSWLHAYIEHRDAGYVLYSIQEAPNLDDDTTREIKALTLQFLSQFSDREETGYVFVSFLKRNDLSRDEERRALELALAWLPSFIGETGAGFVLVQVLSRPDLADPTTRRAADLAVKWLAAFPLSRQADYVLNALLDLSDLDPDIAERTVELALDWLTEFVPGEGTDFMLKSVMERKNLSEADAERIIPLALCWLDEHADHAEAGFVLRPLLYRPELKDDDAAKAMAVTLQWLDAFSDNPKSNFVFKPLLNRSDLSYDSAQQATELALRFLDRFFDGEGTDFLLRSVLERPTLTTEHALRAIPLTMKWLGNNARHKDAGFVLRPLLCRKELRGAEARQCIEFALQWLGLFAEAREAQFVLEPLLNRPDLKGETAERAIATVLRWLDNHARDRNACYVLRPLLGTSTLSGEAARRVVAIARDWLADYGREFAARYVLQPLLDKPDLQDEAATQVIVRALEWLTVHAAEFEIVFVLGPLLARGDLNGRDAEQAVELALTWLPGVSSRQRSGFVIAALLERTNLDEETAQAVVAFALEWLRHNGGDQRASFVIGPLLRCAATLTLAKKVEQEIITRVDEWVARWSDTRSAGFVLAVWTTSRWMQGADGSQVAAAARRWAECYPDMGAGGLALAIRLGLRDGDADANRRLVDVAVSWISRYTRGPVPQHVKIALLFHHVDDGATREATVGAILDVGWRKGLSNRRSLLLAARKSLPADDPKRQEIEVLLER